MNKEKYFEALDYVWYNYYTEELSEEEKEKIEKNLNVVQDSLKRLAIIDKAVEICIKANAQKYVCIKGSYGIIKNGFLDNLDYEVLNDRLYVNTRGIHYDFPLKDYGNWWALTKEELE